MAGKNADRDSLSFGGRSKLTAVHLKSTHLGRIMNVPTTAGGGCMGRMENRIVEG